MVFLISIIGLITPRLLMVFVRLLTDWFSRSYESTIWPVLGWFFLPYTTLAYMAAMLNNHHQVRGWWLVLVIVAVLVDIGVLGGSSSKRKRGHA